LKEEGNDYFRSKQWEEALAAYKSALGYLPRRRMEAKTELREHDEGAKSHEKILDAGTSLSPGMAGSSSSDTDYVKTRSILNANIGACHVKLVSILPRAAALFHGILLLQGEHTEAVSACTKGAFIRPCCI
jgi:hypothetical protein